MNDGPSFVTMIALVAVLVATIVVVSSAGTGGGGGGKSAKGGDSELSQAEKERRRERRRVRARRTSYTVRPGDTIEVISERTRVPRDEIIRLNPDLDPQALQPGQKIKLR